MFVSELLIVFVSVVQVARRVLRELQAKCMDPCRKAEHPQDVFGMLSSREQGVDGRWERKS